MASLYCDSDIVCGVKGCQAPKTHCRFLHLALFDPQSVHMLGEDGELLSDEELSSDDQSDTPSADEQMQHEANESHDESYSSSGAIRNSSVNKVDTGNRVHDTQIGRNTIRKAHYAYIKDMHDKLVRVQVFYDEGADMCQVKNETARIAGIESTGCLDNMYIYKAGERKASSVGKSEMFSVPLYDSDGECRMIVHCMGTDYIGRTRKASIDRVKTKFSKRDLSTLLEPSSGEIHLLVGGNAPQMQPRWNAGKGTCYNHFCYKIPLL